MSRNNKSTCDYVQTAVIPATILIVYLVFLGNALSGTQNTCLWKQIGTGVPTCVAICIVLFYYIFIQTMKTDISETQCFCVSIAILVITLVLGLVHITVTAQSNECQNLITEYQNNTLITKYQNNTLITDSQRKYYEFNNANAIISIIITVIHAIVLFLCRACE